MIITLVSDSDVTQCDSTFSGKVGPFEVPEFVKNSED